jgi:hypothetical protein
VEEVFGAGVCSKPIKTAAVQIWAFCALSCMMSVHSGGRAGHTGASQPSDQPSAAV